MAYFSSPSPASRQDLLKNRPSPAISASFRDENKRFSVGFNVPFFPRREIFDFSIKCTSLESELYPKPRRITLPKLDQRLNPTELNPRKETSGLCEQIEKLIFFKRYHEALELFEIVRSKDGNIIQSTYDALISAIVGTRSIRDAKILFQHMQETDFQLDQYMSNRILLMHIKCGMMLDARRLFDEMPDKNQVTFNTMISGLVDVGDHGEALRLFFILWEEFSEAGSRAIAAAIRAIAGLGRDSSGRQLHSCAVKMGLSDDPFVSCALIDMYSKCGSLKEARWVFDDMPEKTVVGWNTIIAGYALLGHSEEALDLYYEMRSTGVKMDHFTFSIIIRICARLASLEHAKQAHAGLVRNGFSFDVVANTALVDLYCKWGRMEDARALFDRMPQRNLISWNALIGGYANHGGGKEAVAVFERMLSSGMAPNHVTYLAVLGACAYSRMSKKGWEIFKLMTLKHRIKPRAMHYACMIELLGRDGQLEDAFSLIREAPFPPTANMWAALLTACRIHRNVELGKLAAEKLYGMEPEKLSNYIVLLNIYYSSGRRDEAADVLGTLKKKGLRLNPASSWIEIKKQPHQFVFGDKSHPESDGIYERLEKMIVQIGELGYSPEEESLLPDVGEHEDRLRKYHSEKLAVVYGLMSTPDGTPLQIVQGHRVCRDCHNFVKMMSKITGRHIVIRDASRFHHFRQGLCSCGDYW
ncbi:pentatricopeptide repeat (PPR-like) superfamily protein [Wolffia australiana]